MNKAAVAMVLSALVFACGSKPSEESCEQAVDNIRKLTNQTHTSLGADREGAVRACRAQSSGKTVECMAEARTQQELFGCGGAIAEAVRKAQAQQQALAVDDAGPGKPAASDAAPSAGTASDAGAGDSGDASAAVPAGEAATGETPAATDAKAPAAGAGSTP